MAESAISSLVQVLSDVLIKKVKFLQGVEGKVRLLRDELESMQAFLTDANKKQYEEAGVRSWITQLRELAHDAEDTIEMFVNARSDGVLQRCISFPKCVIDLDTIGEEIDSISERLEAIKIRRDTYQIKDLAEAAPSAQSSNVEWRRRQVDDDPVGLEGDVEELLRGSILDEEKRGLSIAVVEGMGGIGKSTLARKIYRHSAVVGGGFDRRAWVVVSSEFKPQETIKQLIIELSSKEQKAKLHEEIKKLEESTNAQQFLQQKLQEMVNELLQGKTYFIVLDDVWEVEHWEFIKNAFPDEQDKKCRILITTRNYHMTKCGQHVYVHKMMGLNPEKSWELLLKKAFVDGQCSQELESMGRRILEKCNGLPLTIGVVGGLLFGKQSISEWEEVLSQINSHLGSVDSYLSAILELSYQNLSPHLKSCFLGLAFFKEDATIFTKRLVNIWVGQGLIRQDGRRTTEEIGRRYLDELINRNMVQIKGLTFDERVKKCQLHDLIRDVCLTKAKEEIGFAMLNRTSTSTESSSSMLRNCVVNDENLLSSLKHNRKLRSLFLDIHELRSDEFRDLMKSSTLLKILDVYVSVGIDVDEMKKLPRCLAKLIGLKYLRIDNSMGSRFVHKRMLEFNSWKLLLRRLPMGVVHIPRWVDRIKKLEVIDIPFNILQFPNVRLNMESLRYLRGGIVEGMVGIESWKNIETLGCVKVGDWIRYVTKLKSTYPLRELSILLNEYKSDRELIMFRESIEKMENLITLRLFIGFPCDARLLIPCHGSRLTKLKIRHGMNICSSADMFPPNLSHLTLKWSGLHNDPMENLGKLPNLSYLNLKGYSYVGSRMKVLHDGFPRLKVLTLKNLKELEEIEIQEGGMPHLKHLQIRSCRKLKTRNLPKYFIISTT